MIAALLATGMRIASNQRHVSDLTNIFSQRVIIENCSSIMFIVLTSCSTFKLIAQLMPIVLAILLYFFLQTTLLPSHLQQNNGHHDQKLSILPK